MNDIQDRITGFWSTVASGYEAHGGNVPARDSAEFAAWARVIAGVLPPAPADVLDVGTGTGFVALIAAEAGHRVTAIDLAQPMLDEASAEAARRHVELRLLQGDAIAPPFPDRTFDVLTSRHLVWTLRDPEAALTAWRKLLRPGGRVVAFDGFWFRPEEEAGPGGEEGLFDSFYNPETRQRLPGWQFFDTQPIVTLFERAGFTCVSTTPLDEVHRLALHPPSERPSYALVGFAP